MNGEIRVLRNFTLIDGTGRAPQPSAAMIINEGRIEWLGPARQLKIPPSVEVVDLSGKYVMPGIINLHGHIGNTVDLTQDKKFFTRENIERNLRTYASYGVTTVLSMGTDQDLIFKMRDEQRPERPTMTRIYTAGQGFVYKGGYGGLAGVNEGIADVAEVRPAVDAQASKHVDIIKLWMDDHLGTAKKMPYDIAMHVQRSWHLLSALFTAKFNSRTVPAGDMLRALMPTPAQFAACKQLSLRPKAVYAEGCACRAIAAK